MAAPATVKRPQAITKLSDTPNDGKRNWLIYAPSGVGKTVLAGTAPNALFLTVEAAGTESAKARGSDADEWICDSWEELQAAFIWIRDGGHKLYEWVIVDSLSEMEELCWKDHLEEAHAGNSSRSIYAAAIQDYGVVDNKVKALVDKFNRLPVNVLYTAQMASMDAEDSSGDDVTVVLPLLGRAKNGWPLSMKICGKVTLIGFLTVKQPKDKDEEPFRRLWVQGGERWIAKDRHDTFGKYIDEPDISEMVDEVDKRQASAGPKKAAKKASSKEGK
jgi:hypothetical protein